MKERVTKATVTTTVMFGIIDGGERSDNNDSIICGSGIVIKIYLRGWSKWILVEEILVHPTKLCPSSPWWERRSRRRLVDRDKHQYGDADNEWYDCDNDYGDDDNEYGDDDDNGEDLDTKIGQPIDHIVQVVLIKTLKEIAKCNTRQLLNNIFPKYLRGSNGREGSSLWMSC